MTKHYMKYGLIISVLLIVYFLVLRFFNLHTLTVLSAFNAVIFGFGIYQAITNYKKNHTKFKYEKGFQAGLLSGAFASVLFGIVMAIYMYHIDPEFATTILEGWDVNLSNGPLTLIVSVLIMGLATSFVLTLAFMQLLKDSWNTNQNKPN
ncbi:DUF4199 domain-containing protein [Planktosalinus lacus]|uniref:DUF4199 domain-containing protein n=1 Tax=Planktosalinus lacus TaxID=1526573 RepID=A0A8J2VA62_9FLAO|nr:DUF4199 domain-containing protein [Planktosalinus lacus]GGD96130.1 hypothetical protein GCM10011312_19640 [Planktosalinus lacus]